MKRSNIPEATIERLINYYGGKKCVITGLEDSDGYGVDWAHLDENPNNHNFDNIIPLGTEYNRTQEEYRRNNEQKEVKINRTTNLKAQHLSFQADQNFNKGYPALAYGCSKLGQILAHKYFKEFEAEESDELTFFCQSIYYLPYKFDYELLESVLLSLDKYLTNCASCPMNLRIALLLAIANLYQDLGKWDDADEVYCLIDFQGNSTSNIIASQIRRRGIGSIFSNNRHADPIINFDKSYDLCDLSDFRTSIVIAKGWMYQTQGNYKQALSVLEPYKDDLLSKNPSISIKSYCAHNIFEYALTSASAKSRLNKNYRKELNIVKQLHEYSPHTRLRPVFSMHISKLIFGPEINQVIPEISMPLIETPRLLYLLKSIVSRIVLIPVSNVNGRLRWVD